MPLLPKLQQPSVDLRQLYFNAPMPDPRQGGISVPKATVKKTLHNFLEDQLRKVTSDRSAARYAEKLTGVLDAATPAGNVFMAQDGVNQALNGVRNGSLAGALKGTGLVALAVVPGSPRAKKFAEALYGIRAYHGSPYDFDKFDASKIGTGEGAQAYGHGLYFTDSKRLAQSYREPDLGRQIKRQGHLYEVGINAKPEQFIDWDTPLIAQPEPVQKLARSADLSHLNSGHRARSLIERFVRGDELPDYRASGGVLHNVLTDYGRNTEANRRLSEALAGEGFAGLRYGQPRDALGGGGRNYVVFDPALIDILAKH